MLSVRPSARPYGSFVPPFYFATRANGSHFFADGVAAPGITLNAIAPPKPFPPRGLRASENIETSLSLFPSEWPLRLWTVEGTPDADLTAAEGLKDAHAFAQLTVVEEVPVVEALGPHGSRILALFDQLQTLRATDVDPLATTVEDEWLESQPEGTDPESSPFNAALSRCGDAGREHHPALYWRLGHIAQKLGEDAAGPLFDIDLTHAKGRPYDTAKRHFGSAAYCADMAILASAHVSAEDFQLMTEDLRRLCGIHA